MVKFVYLRPMTNQDIANLQLDGGCFVFDFINTVNTRVATPARDYLNTYKDVLQWSAKALLLPSKDIRALGQYADKNKDDAQAAFSKLIGARETLYQLFAAVTRKEKPEPGTLDKFNRLLGQSFGKMKMEIATAKASIHFSGDEVSLDEPLRLIMKSAYDVLTAQDFDRLKECPGCGWIFLDQTKNGKRRWCDMKVCGSNDKAKRYYYRKKENA